MTVTTYFGQTLDGRILSSHASVYATARSGNSLAVDTVGTLATTGQDTSGGFRVFESFFSWDTSTSPAGETVSAAALSFCFVSFTPATNFVFEARDFDWGASLTTADFVPGANLSADTLLASINTAALTIDGVTYATLTNNAGNLEAWVKTVAASRLICVSDQTTTGVAPTTADILGPVAADTAGTTSDPKLVVTTVGPPPPPFPDDFEYLSSYEDTLLEEQAYEPFHPAFIGTPLTLDPSLYLIPQLADVEPDLSDYELEDAPPGYYEPLVPTTPTADLLLLMSRADVEPDLLDYELEDAPPGSYPYGILLDPSLLPLPETDLHDEDRELEDARSDWQAWEISTPADPDPGLGLVAGLADIDPQDEDREREDERSDWQALEISTPIDPGPALQAVPALADVEPQDEDRELEDERSQWYADLVSTPADPDPSLLLVPALADVDPQDEDRELEDERSSWGQPIAPPETLIEVLGLAAFADIEPQDEDREREDERSDWQAWEVSVPVTEIAALLAQAGYVQVDPAELEEPPEAPEEPLTVVVYWIETPNRASVYRLPAGSVDRLPNLPRGTVVRVFQRLPGATAEHTAPEPGA